MLIFLWFPNDVKANVRISFDSSPSDITRFIYTFKGKGSRYIVLPFSSKINFRTFYNFDLGLRQEYGIYLSRKKAEGYSPSFKSISTSKPYKCQNEATSFIPTFFLCPSKRKEIKKFFERVVFCFDFSLSFLSLEVALLTKDGARFKFFHLPECKKAEDEVKKDEGDIGRPFNFSFFDCINKPRHGFLKLCGYSLEDIKGNSDMIESVDKYFSFLFWLASCFTFCFDIMICSYLFCCIEIPIRSVFELFFLFRYLFLEKKCEELSKKYGEENEHRWYKADEEGKNELGILLLGKEYKRDSMLVACKGFSLELLTQALNFSIRF